MPRAKKKYHYLYKTTNLINNKYYCGMHSTSNLEDGYLGSGLKLRCSIRKYGKENFKLEILEFFDDREKLIEAEIKLITEELIDDEFCMNLMNGGSGGNAGFSTEQYREWASLGGKKAMQKIQNDPELKIKFTKIYSDTLKRTHKEGKIKYGTFIGKNHTEETKNKIGSANSKKQQGKLNSQYGTCWITNSVENKKIKIEELENYISLGWIKGRKIKNA